KLPYELLEALVHEVQLPPDLLNLAVTCTTFRQIIIPNHLEYCVIAVVAPQVEIWEHFIQRPNLARCVRRL
ncbi:hypothetical protein K488DRAFT_7795, partial [Vararia minispora EC-137]